MKSPVLDNNFLKYSPLRLCRESLLEARGQEKAKTRKKKERLGKELAAAVVGSGTMEFQEWPTRPNYRPSVEMSHQEGNIELPEFMREMLYTPSGQGPQFAAVSKSTPVPPSIKVAKGPRPLKPKAGAEKKNGRWTEDEHKLFLQGYELHGRDWKKISTIVPTRSPVQIRTHAQKYFLKAQRAGAAALNNADARQRPKVLKNKNEKPENYHDLYNQFKKRKTDVNIPQTPLTNQSVSLQNKRSYQIGKSSQQPSRALWAFLRQPQQQQQQEEQQAEYHIPAPRNEEVMLPPANRQSGLSSFALQCGLQPPRGFHPRFSSLFIHLYSFIACENQKGQVF